MPGPMGMGNNMVIQFGSVGAGVLSGDIDKVSSSLKRLGATMAAVTAATVGFGTAFEQGMANVQSVARASAGDLNLLEKTARNLARTTVRDATRATSAMYTLASAGLSVKEIMETTAPVIYLSGATLHNLRDSAEMVVGTLKQFGLATDQSWRVANVFAASIQNSLLNMERLGDAMKYVGPIARSVNLRIEETTAALMGLHDAGLLGSISGTGLRQMFLRLAKPTEDISRMLGGVSLSANGLSAVLDQLNASQMTTADLFKLFNVRAVNAMMILRRLGSEGLAEYLSKITDTNSAMEMFNIQMNTMKSQFIIFWNKMKDIGIEVFQRMQPLLSHTLSFMTQIVDKVGDWLRAGSSSEAEKWVEYMRAMNVEGEEYVGLLEDYNRLATFEQLAHQMDNAADKMNLFDSYTGHSVDVTKQLRDALEGAQQEAEALESEARAISSLPPAEEYYGLLPQDEIRKIQKWRQEVDDGTTSAESFGRASKEVALIQEYLDKNIESVNRGLGASEEVVRAYARAHNMGMEEARKALEQYSMEFSHWKTALVTITTGQVIPIIEEATERTEAAFKFETAQENLERLQSAFAELAVMAKAGDTTSVVDIGTGSLDLLSTMINQMVRARQIVVDFGDDLSGAFASPEGLERVQTLFAELGFDIPLVAEEGDVAARALRDGSMRASQVLEGLRSQYTFLFNFIKDEAPEVWNAMSKAQQEVLEGWIKGDRAGAKKAKAANADLLADYQKILSNTNDAILAIEKMRDQYRVGAMQATDWGDKGGQALKTLMSAALEGTVTFDQLKVKLDELAKRDPSLQALLPSAEDLREWYDGTIPVVGEFKEMTLQEMEDLASGLQEALAKTDPADREALLGHWQDYWTAVGIGGEDAMKLVADGMEGIEGSTATSGQSVKALIQAVKGFRDIATAFDWGSVFEPEEFQSHVADMRGALASAAFDAQSQMAVMKGALVDADEGVKQATLSLLVMMQTLAGGPVAVEDFIEALDKLDNTLITKTAKAGITLGQVLESVAHATANMITNVTDNGTEKLYKFLEALGQIAIQAGIAAFMLAETFKAAIATPWIAAALIGVGLALKTWASSKLKDLRNAEDASAVSIGAFAQGGVVGGKGGVDNNLAWISRGEYVMPVEETQRYLPLLEAMRSNMVPSFAGGGVNHSSDSLEPGAEGGGQTLNFNFYGTVVGGNQTAIRNLARELRDYIFEESL